MPTGFGEFKPYSDKPIGEFNLENKLLPSIKRLVWAQDGRKFNRGGLIDFLKNLNHTIAFLDGFSPEEFQQIKLYAHALPVIHWQSLHEYVYGKEKDEFPKAESFSLK